RYVSTTPSAIAATSAPSDSPEPVRNWARVCGSAIAQPTSATPTAMNNHWSLRVMFIAAGADSADRDLEHVDRARIRVQSVGDRQPLTAGVLLDARLRGTHRVEDLETDDLHLTAGDRP